MPGFSDRDPSGEIVASEFEQFIDAHTRPWDDPGRKDIIGMGVYVPRSSYPELIPGMGGFDRITFFALDTEAGVLGKVPANYYCIEYAKGDRTVLVLGVTPREDTVFRVSGDNEELVERVKNMAPAVVFRKAMDDFNNAEAANQFKDRSAPGDSKPEA